MSGILPVRTLKFGPVELGAVFLSTYLCYTLFQSLRRRRRSTRLNGPSTTFSNYIFGLRPLLTKLPDPGAAYEEWAQRYGAVYSIPALLGNRTVVLTDTKSIAHFAARETYGYVMSPNAKHFQERLLGRGLFWAEGDSHKRQRRALNPAFTNAAIKDLTPIFFDSAYKAKAAWDSLLEGRPEGTIIEVQIWMNHISLDTIGLAGFSHDFGTLTGQNSSIAEAFDNIGSKASFWDSSFFLLALIIPVLRNIPFGRNGMLMQLTKTMFSLGDEFLETTKETASDKSVMGLLVKSASADKISHEEVKAQINVLLIAGYETTAISLTWALIELSRNPDMQTKLRDEILHSSDGDLTWEELNHQGSFLDAFTCEILRFHPPVGQVERMAAEDDVLPLNSPLETADGNIVDGVFVVKGTIVKIPIDCMNRSEVFWGTDAKLFNPTRWIDETNGISKHRAQEIQGYRHMLTFSDGARICLGKAFAVTEFKAVLSVLLRNYTFELPNGPETVIGRHLNVLPRPKVEGEAGYDVPLRVRPYMGRE
ncbi:cytochrome P450 [Favolaschia claudopus]|uniref:Cytochrome P450 n=1 Tax=Favolaschia claudopus TaxID=2862362 RepID=A0AAW0D1J6_9AGAR